MIQSETELEVADNSGALALLCIKVLGGSKRRYASVGDVVICSVKKVTPTSGVKKKAVVRALIVTTKASIRRKDGSMVRFDRNSAVLVDEQGKPVGTRVNRSIAREVLDKKYTRVASLAPEVL